MAAGLAGPWNCTAYFPCATVVVWTVIVAPPIDGVLHFAGSIWPDSKSSQKAPPHAPTAPAPPEPTSPAESTPPASGSGGVWPAAPPPAPFPPEPASPTPPTPAPPPEAPPLVTPAVPSLPAAPAPAAPAPAAPAAPAPAAPVAERRAPLAHPTKRATATRAQATSFIVVPSGLRPMRDQP